MSSREFIVESFRMLSRLTGHAPKYLDQDIVDKTVQIIYRLVNLENALFDLILEAEIHEFRTDYFATLENLNAYARVNSAEETLLWIRIQLEETLDTMCTYVGLPDIYEYSGKELGFSLFKFDQQSALKTKRGHLKALDASYAYNAYTMYNWFTMSTPGDLCTQVYS